MAINPWGTLGAPNPRFKPDNGEDASYWSPEDLAYFRSIDPTFNTFLGRGTGPQTDDIANQLRIATGASGAQNPAITLGGIQYQRLGMDPNSGMPFFEGLDGSQQGGRAAEATRRLMESGQVIDDPNDPRVQRYGPLADFNTYQGIAGDPKYHSSSGLDYMPQIGAAAFLGGAATGFGGIGAGAEGGLGGAATVSGAADDLFLSQLAGEGVTGGTAGVEAGLGGGLTGGNVSNFFPDIVDTGFTGGFIDPSLGPSILDTQFSNLPPLDTPTGFITPGLTEAGLSSGLPGFINEGFSGLGGTAGTNLDALSKLLGKGSSLFGGRDLLGTGLALAPSLAAIQYARNQGPFDTSRLRSAYNQIDPNALALPYDLETASGRTRLNSSLTDRGVMGSSFGNQDIASYDMLRHAGRQNIFTQGATGQANIANMILNSDIKERALKNDLYGRALLALSSGLNPPPARPQPQQDGTSDILKALGLGGSIYNMFS